MARELKIGFVGTGGIATDFHLPALKEIEGVEIAAVCDTAKERAEATAQKLGGRAYPDHHEMLEREKLDALFVCLPPFAHTDAELIAASKGLHLYVEKPVAMDMAKGLEIAAAIKKAGIVSCVGYQLRYLPVATAARDFLAGKGVALVAANRWGGVPGDASHWWRVMEKSGGMLHEMATHNLDFVRYVVGDVTRVSARYSLNVLKDMEHLTVPDAQVVLLEFRNGATGYFSTSCALTKGGGWSSTDVILRDMRLRIGWEQIEVSPEGAAKIALPEAGPSIHETFVEAIRRNDPSLVRSDYADALKTTEITLGANESARTGKPVEMRLG